MSEHIGTRGIIFAVITACSFIFIVSCHSRVTDTSVLGGGFGLPGGDTSGSAIGGAAGGNGGTPNAATVKAEAKIVRLDGTEMEILDFPYAPLAVSIKTTFSEAMNKDTVKNATKLTDPKGNQVAGIFEWPDDKTMIFTPQTKAPYRAKLAPKTKYSFQITSDAVSSVGSLLEAVDKTFTTMTLGDVNGDSMPDFVVGSRGAVYIYSGDAPSDHDPIATINEFPDGIQIASVAMVGDVDADGYADVIIGNPKEKIRSGENQGAAYFFSGKKLSGTLKASNADAIINGIIPGGFFGISIAGAQDVNGDGFDDVIVGTYSTSFVYIYSGDTLRKQGSTRKEGNEINMAELNGETPDSVFGISVSYIGDVNKDGLADIIIGADNFESGAGKIYIFSGADLKDEVLPQKAIATLKGADKSRLGATVAGVGDVDGDGIGDFLVGLPFADPNVVYLFGGDKIGPNLKSTDGKLYQPIDEAYSGCSLSGIGDVNNDGKADFIIGAPGKNEIYLYTGLPVPAKITSTEQWFGYSVSGIGDINNDNKPEFIVGSPVQSNKDGAVYMYSSKGTTQPMTIYKGKPSAKSAFGHSVSGTFGGGLCIIW